MGDYHGPQIGASVASNLKLSLISPGAHWGPKWNVTDPEGLLLGKGSADEMSLYYRVGHSRLATVSANAATGQKALKGHEFEAQSKVTLTAARSIALKARPGKIVDQELEREGGGSGLRYSFDIVSHHKTIEVGVDAKTGKVLENGAESASKEAKETVRENTETKPK